MNIVPILLLPRLLAIKNRWFHSGRRGLKELATLAVSALMMTGIYISSLASLRDVTQLAPTMTIDPAIPLGVMLGTLFLMIFLSASVSAIGALFLSKDLDITLSAPLSPSEFLVGKTVDVGISVSWMVCVFMIPALLAFGSFYNGDTLFMVGAPILCALFLALAVSLGMITAIIFAAILPSEKGRPVLIALFLLSLGVFLALLNGFSEGAPLADTDHMKILHQATALGSNPWLPSTHCARALTGLLRRDYLVPLLTLFECVGALSILGLCMRLAHERLYERALSRTGRVSGILKIHSRSAHRLAKLLFPFSSSVTRAIMTKEYKVFSRDLTHTVQLSLLLGITFVYLYNYQLVQGPSRMSDEALAVWRIFLLLSNIALGSLVITSICSRFVFPSVSLEGTSFWLIQASPISLKDLLKAKFKSWLLPVSCIGGVIFVSGAMALNAEVPLVVASCAAGIILCHGLVGLGIGFGALFSQFEWEHSTQLSTSLGNFVFMITCMMFLAFNMVPLGLMFGTYMLFPEAVSSDNLTLVVLGGGLLSTYILNKLVVWWALSAGARALRTK